MDCRYFPLGLVIFVALERTFCVLDLYFKLYSLRLLTPRPRQCRVPAKLQYTEMHWQLAVEAATNCALLSTLPPLFGIMFLDTMYFTYNSANTQYITTLTTGVMFTKHLPHSCVWQNVIRKMRMSLDSSCHYKMRSLW